MNEIETIRDRIPEYARDLGLNLGSVLSPQGSPGLTEAQIIGAALASAIASRNPDFAGRIERAVADTVDEATITAARSAAAVMGMNNIYYRFAHLVDDGDYLRMPARLRMNVIRNPGVDRADFELFSLAVSAVNGCGLCVSSHEKDLRKAGISAEGIQSAARIAAVVHAVAAVLEYEGASVEDTRAAA